MSERTTSFDSGDIHLSGFTKFSRFRLPPGLPDSALYWRVKAYRHPNDTRAESTAYSVPRAFVASSCPCACDCHTDPVCDSLDDILDIVAVIDAAFWGMTPASDPNAACPYLRADVNCDAVTNVADVVQMIDYAIRHQITGPGLCGLCD